MLRKTLLYLTLFFLVPGYGQNYASYWFFGEHAGLNFNNEVQSIINPAFQAEAGCAVICDSTGSLLFYTNGTKVWNRNHSLLHNGDSLKGNPQLNQNSLIVPLLESNNIYYLFTIGSQDSTKGFHYSIIDMNIDNGLGGVTDKNIHIKSGVLEKITGVEHCNSLDYWVIIHDDENNFLCYQIDKNGLIETPIISTVGSIPKADIGYMKVSPGGNHIVLPINDDSLLAEVLEFDSESGLIFNPRGIIANEEDTYCYGVAFSSSGSRMYISTRGKDYSVWQYNLSYNNLSPGSRIATGNNFAMQLAPDGIIYIASENRSYLNAILNPGAEGEDCNYLSQAIILENSKSLMGLPNFIQSWFYKSTLKVENLCLGDSTIIYFDGYANYDSCRLEIIDQNNEIIKTAQILPAVYTFDNAGNYTFQVQYYHCGIEEVMYTDYDIIDPPESQLRNETIYAGAESLELDAGEGFDSYYWSSGGTGRFETVYNAGDYYVEKVMDGCIAIDTIIVQDLLYRPYLPNAFTPNNDGNNDCFGVVNPLTGFNLKLYVISPNGNVLFESNDPTSCWDGTFKDEPCRNGTYVYKVLFEDYYNGERQAVQLTGTITLIR